MKVFIETYGCSANINDSEIMAGLIGKAGHQVVAALEEADAVIVNTCTVKGPTESRISARIKQLNAGKKKLIVAGCMAETQQEMLGKIAPDSSLVGTHKLDKIIEALEGKFSVSIGPGRLDKALLPRVSVNPVVGIVQINDGCMGSCTFCITKAARGTTFSYPMGSIRNAVEELVQKGVREIWLTSQDSGTYGLDRRTSLPGLLQKLCEIDGDFKIRVGMMNPTLANHLLKPLIGSFNHDKVFKFLHIPLQSGSDKVLAAMKRGYSVETFKTIVREFRSAIPKITIATDIICGFPCETEKDFEATLAVLREIKNDVINSSRFRPRPGPDAAKLERLPDSVIMSRSKKLHVLSRQITLQKNLEFIGWEGHVFVDELGKKAGTFIGRNFAYKPIVVSGKGLLGRDVKVKIEGAEHSNCIGNNV